MRTIAEPEVLQSRCRFAIGSDGPIGTRIITCVSLACDATVLCDHVAAALLSVGLPEES